MVLNEETGEHQTYNKKIQLDGSTPIHKYTVGLL